MNARKILVAMIAMVGLAAAFGGGLVFTKKQVMAANPGTINRIAWTATATCTTGFATDPALKKFMYAANQGTGTIGTGNADWSVKTTGGYNNTGCHPTRGVGCDLNSVFTGSANMAWSDLNNLYLQKTVVVGDDINGVYDSANSSNPNPGDRATIGAGSTGASDDGFAIVSSDGYRVNPAEAVDGDFILCGHTVTTT